MSKINYKEIYKYIEDCIENDGCTLKDRRDKILYLQKRLYSEYFDMLVSHSTQYALAEWLKSMAIDIAFDSKDILDLAKKWGSLPEDATEKQENKILDNYYPFMAWQIIKMAKGQGLRL